MSDQIQNEKPANPFLPIALVAVSIICFLGPTAWDASQIKTNLTAARDQQATGLAQSQPIMGTPIEVPVPRKVIVMSAMDLNRLRKADSYHEGHEEHEGN